MSHETAMGCLPAIRRTPTLALALATLLLLPHAARADAALDSYNSAVGLQKEKRWELASEAFRRFLKEFPQHEKAPFAQMYLGLSLLNQEKYADARNELKTFIEKYPQSRNLPDAQYRMGEASYLLGDMAMAEKDLGTFLSQNPKHELAEWALPYLADAELRQKKYDAAVTHFKAALDQHPKGRLADEAKFGLARALEGLKKTDEAVVIFREIASEKLNPRAPQAQLQIGNHLYDRGEFELAAAAFLKFDEEFPKHSLASSARMNSGYAFLQARKYEQAIARFEAAGADAGQKPAADYWSGVCLQSLGKPEEASKKFQNALTLDPKGTIAEKALYQWAEIEFQAGRFESSGQRFQELAERFPQSDQAASARQFAVESALRLGKADEAQKALDRWPAEQRDAKSHPQFDLLQGRLLELRGGAENFQKARGKFETVVSANGKDAAAVALARLLLARNRHRDGDHAAAIEAVAGLVDAAFRSTPDSYASDAVALTMTCRLAARQEAAAIALATATLESPKLMALREQALATRSIALARTADFAKARGDLDRLEKDFAKSPALPQTLLDVAEAAYAKGDYAAATDFFERIVKLPMEPALRPAALSGLAWSLFQAGKFPEAAARFGEAAAAAPNDPARSSEAAFMQGLSWQRASDLKKAAESYAQGWGRLAPKSPVAAGAEAEGQPLHYAFRCGWKAAQVNARLKNLDAADKLYDAVATLFPAAKDRDKVLDDWALLHYEAEDFAKADELFRRLVAEYPKSDRADDARLNLAESDYVARKTDTARKEFQAVATSPTASERVKSRAVFNLVKIAAELREWKEVVALAEKRPAAPNGAGIDADRWQVDAFLAEAKLNLNDAKAAKELLAAIYARKADLPRDAGWFAQVRILLAEANCQLKDYAAVASLVEEFRKDDPQSKVLHRAEEILGRVYKNQAKFSEARSQFEKVINDPSAFRTETAAKCQFLVAETHLLQKDYRNAQIEYYKVEQLYKFPEWQSSSLYQVAKCDEAMNHWKDAVKAYEDLLKKYPDSAAAAKAKTDLLAARKRLADGG